MLNRHQTLVRFRNLQVTDQLNIVLSSRNMVSATTLRLQNTMERQKTQELEKVTWGQSVPNTTFCSLVQNSIQEMSSSSLAPAPSTGNTTVLSYNMSLEQWIHQRSITIYEIQNALKADREMLEAAAYDISLHSSLYMKHTGEGNIWIADVIWFEKWALNFKHCLKLWTSDSIRSHQLWRVSEADWFNIELKGKFLIEALLVALCLKYVWCEKELHWTPFP